VTFPIDNRPGPTVLGSPVNAASTRIETLPPLACLHCAATQATVRRDRQIADALLGYPTECVCCDPETGDACPRQPESGVWQLRLRLRLGDRLCRRGRTLPLPGLRLYRRRGRRRPRSGDAGSGAAQAHDDSAFCGGVAGRGVMLPSSRQPELSDKPVCASVWSATLTR